MPAGFNKGQIEYIKSIANVNGHKTYRSQIVASQTHQVTTGTQAANDTHMRYAVWCLGARPAVNPVGDVGASTDRTTDTTMTPIDVYTVPIQTDPEQAGDTQRVTPECFLESVRMKMRQITDLDNTVDAQSHKEFRLVVFRHREKQHHRTQLAENFSNPLYDMFHGAQNTNYGPKGYRARMDDAGNLNYAAWSGYTASYDRDRMLTDPINKADYVVMKDCRYYLGREYGGKHIYEDEFFWDHEDPIATAQDDLTTSESNKNYCWYVMLLCSNNSGSAVQDLGYINFVTNTYVTSG